MSDIKQSRTSHASSPRPSFRATLAGLISRALVRWHRGQAAAALHRLDDRQLEDIGISRNDIPRIAAGLIPTVAEASGQDTQISVHPTRFRKAA